MTTFRIVEGGEYKWHENFDEFVDLYNHSDLSVEDIRRSLDWNQRNLQQARVKARKEGLITPRRAKYPRVRRNSKKYFTPPKYYSMDNSGKCAIRKTVNGRLEYFGYYSEDDAKKIVSELKKVNWDKNALEDIRKKVLSKKGGLNK